MLVATLSSQPLPQRVARVGIHILHPMHQPSTVVTVQVPQVPPGLVAQQVLVVLG